MAETYQFKGKLVEKFDEQQVSATFVKREFVVEKKEQDGSGKTYLDHVKFQLIQGKVTLIENIAIGTEVEVSFNVKGKRYEKDGKVSFFNSLDAWKVAAVGSSANLKPNDKFNEEPVRTAAETQGQEDDLPF